MKITFCPVVQHSSIMAAPKQIQQRHTYCANNENGSETVSVPAANYYPVSFHAKPDSTMLLAQSDKLLCAYSRRPMLSLYKFRTICAKLSKKTNAQSAINFLKEYRDYMPAVETEIFDMFEEYGARGKTTFQDILMEKRQEALTNLRGKQRDIMHSTDRNILKYDKDLAEQLFYLRDVALLKVEDGTFSRSEILENLENILEYTELSEKDKQNLNEIYKKWYKLPRSYMDYDAFIVKYSKFSHNEIAQRLLSMAVATVEHIIAYARGGEDKLGNYALTCMLYNQDKRDMNLARYDACNPEIGLRENLPKYIDDICGEIKRGNPYFCSYSAYPSELRQSIITETGWESFMPEIEPPKQIKISQIPGSKKGANRYRGHRK